MHRPLVLYEDPFGKGSMSGHRSSTESISEAVHQPSIYPLPTRLWYYTPYTDHWASTETLPEACRTMRAFQKHAPAIGLLLGVFQKYVPSTLYRSEFEIMYVPINHLSFTDQGFEMMYQSIIYISLIRVWEHCCTNRPSNNLQRSVFFLGLSTDHLLYILYRKFSGNMYRPSVLFQEHFGNT